MQNPTHKDLQNSGLYNKPFFTTKYLSINDIDFHDICFNEKLHRKYSIDEDNLTDLSEDDVYYYVIDNFNEAVGTYNYHRQVDEFDFNEENAYKSDLIPFKYFDSNEGEDIYLLALGGCGMDLSPKLDAYFFLQTGKMDPASRYFSDKEYFKSLVSTEIFNAIDEKFGENKKKRIKRYKKITKEELDKIVIAHAKWLQKLSGGKCADLSRVDLSGADLYGVDLRFAEIDNANFSGAKLQFANLAAAYSAGADFSGADLSDANLAFINLTNAILIDAILIDVDLSHAKVSGADLSGADLSGADLSD